MSAAGLGRKPRLGFLGVGWIGAHRMRAVREQNLADIVGLADPSEDLRDKAREGLDNVRTCSTLDELLHMELDGIAIATPSALHAEHALACLERGVSVFCQKPLARDARETRQVVDAARTRDRLLAVDFSYRHTRALRALKQVIDSGELGNIYSARFVFHNAYGPDKPWYYERASSGGGCVVDLGIHWIDSALWLLEPSAIDHVDSALYARGKRLAAGAVDVEDYASARLHTREGASIELACSWKLPVGRDAEITAEIFGEHGGVRFRNVNGSFYDFIAERMNGTATHVLAEPPDEWGGGAIIDWARRLARSPRFDASAETFVRTAEILDRIYLRDANTLAPRD